MLNRAEIQPKIEVARKMKEAGNIKRNTMGMFSAPGNTSYGWSFARHGSSVRLIDGAGKGDPACIPYSIMPCVVGDVPCPVLPLAVGVGDPKGAGVSTTSQRYSRKMHRQTDVFPIPSPIPTFWFHCLGSSKCEELCLESSYRRYFVRFASDFVDLGVGSAFLQTPGVLTTRKSDVISYND